MQMENNSHDNINVKVNSRISIYGNVIFVGSASLALVGFLFLAIFMHAYWQQAVTLATIVIYGLVLVLFLVLAALVSALWIRFVVHPSITAQERRETLRGQQMRNRVVWAQPNAIV